MIGIEKIMESYLNQNRMIYIPILLIISSMMLLNGCMMPGMMTHSPADQQNEDHNRSAQGKIVKEIIADDYRIVAEYSSEIVQQESSIHLGTYLLNDSTLLPVQGRVTLKDVGNNNTISTQLFGILKDQKYVYKFSVNQPSEYRIIFEIETINNNTLPKPIVFDVFVKSLPLNSSAAVSGGFKLSTPIIVGGIVMVTMMIIMIMIKPF
ncbi:MAG: hypothetical protein QME58_02640 [Bacteroidota bacterium]|nr:hypothetical protein [Bacteroidota bacterium]